MSLESPKHPKPNQLLTPEGVMLFETFRDGFLSFYPTQNPSTIKFIDGFKSAISLLINLNKHPITTSAIRAANLGRLAFLAWHAKTKVSHSETINTIRSAANSIKDCISQEHLLTITPKTFDQCTIAQAYLDHVLTILSLDSDTYLGEAGVTDITVYSDIDTNYHTAKTQSLSALINDAPDKQAQIITSTITQLNKKLQYHAADLEIAITRHDIVSPIERALADINESALGHFPQHVYEDFLDQCKMIMGNEEVSEAERLKAIYDHVTATYTSPTTELNKMNDHEIIFKTTLATLPGKLHSLIKEAASPQSSVAIGYASSSLGQFGSAEEKRPTPSQLKATPES